MDTVCRPGLVVAHLWENDGMDLSPTDLSVIRDSLAYSGRDPLGHGGSFNASEYLRVLALLED